MVEHQGLLESSSYSHGSTEDLRIKVVDEITNWESIFQSANNQIIRNRRRLSSN